MAITMDDIEEYSYKDLLGFDAIRIIKLFPSDSLNDEVHCELLHTSLTDCEEDIHSLYTAISYVWGDVQDTRVIFVDGKKLNITTTLESALRHIRLKKEPSRLWADAICINQLDLEERGRQVRQMGAIYACASHTIIYLNSPTPEAELFLETLRQHNANLRKGFHSNEQVLKVCNRLWLLSRESFLQQAWLSRIWVLQELLFSKDPWIQCGSTRCRWDDFCQYARSFQEPGKNITPAPVAPTPDSISDFTADFRLWDSIQSYSIYDIGATMNGLELLLAMARFRNDFYDPSSNMFGDRFLLTLLQARRALGVTDPRDMLYAHSTIARSAELADEFRDLISVDYSKSCEKLFMNMAQYFFEKSTGYGILSFVEDIQLQSRRPGSWAPDWTVAQSPKPWLSITDWTTTHRRWQYSDEVYSNSQAVVGHMYSGGQRVGFDWVHESDFTHGWTEDLLIGVGVHIAKIGRTSDILTNVVELFDMKWFFAEEYSESRIDESAIGLDVYTRLCKSINEALGESIILDPRSTLPAEVPFFMQRNKVCTAEHYECRSRIVDIINSQDLIGPSSAPRILRDSDTTQYIIPTLVKAAYIPGDTSIFTNRRLTALPDGRLALVPTSARPGDLIVCLAGSAVPYVLRPHTGDSQISNIDVYNSFVQKGNFKSYAPRGCMACHINMATCNKQKSMCVSCQKLGSDSCKEYNIHNTQTLPTEHYSFIGECFVETLMMGWTAPELERRNKIIFALH